MAPPEVKGLKDTTGAGDAYLGGMIVGLVHDGLPKTKEELRSASLKKSLLTVCRFLHKVHQF